MNKEDKKNRIAITTAAELSGNVKTMKPGIWILVCAILAFLVGFFIFAVNSSYSSTISVCAYVQNDRTLYMVKDKDTALIKAGQKVYFPEEGVTNTITGIDPEPYAFSTEVYGNYVAEMGDYKDGDRLYDYFSPSTVSEGVHQAYIYVEELNLLSLFFN